MDGKRSDPGDPLFQASLALRREGVRLELETPHSVFASARLDAGTLLLLRHLPAGEPARFLDLGCGYGALGLAVAARFPRARGVLIDRDLLAVEYARRNARRNDIANVEVLPGLGYRDLPPAAEFDWIVANVPARAGARVMEEFLVGGMARLHPGGELRLVVIAPLAAALRDIAGRRGLACESVAGDEGHAVLSFPARRVPGAGAGGAPDEAAGDVYERDRIELALPEPLRLVRPTDLADEPHRLPVAIPLLAGSLPRVPPARVLAYRSGYGLVPALVLARYPGAAVVAADRDLLAAAYTRRNCAAAVASGRLRVEENLRLADLAPLGPFDLVVGEILAPLGSAATLAELGEARRLLAPGGRALVLGLEKQWREFLRPAARRLGLAVRRKDASAALYQMNAKGSSP